VTSGWMDDELTEGIGVEKKSIFSILMCLFYFLSFFPLPLFLSYLIWFD